MNRFVIVVAGLLLAGAVPASASSLINGDFESGDLTGWSTTVPSNAVVNEQVVSGPWTASQGNYFAQMVTDNTGSGKFVTLFQTTSLKAGDQVSFDYFFYDSTPNQANQAKASVGSSTLTLQGAGAVSQVGKWSTATLAPVPADGTYTVSFGITNGGATNRGIFGVDNVRISGGAAGDPADPPAQPPSSAPEPLTLLSVILGVGSLAGYIRRKRMM